MGVRRMDMSGEEKLVNQGWQGEMEAYKEMGLFPVSQVGTTNEGSRVFHCRGVCKDLHVNIILDQVVSLELLDPLLTPASLPCPWHLR